VACALFCPYGLLIVYDDSLLIVYDDSESEVGCVMSDNHVKVCDIDADVWHGCVRGWFCQEAFWDDKCDALCWQRYICCSSNATILQHGHTFDQHFNSDIRLWLLISGHVTFGMYSAHPKLCWAAVLLLFARQLHTVPSPMVKAEAGRKHIGVSAQGKVQQAQQ